MSSLQWTGTILVFLGESQLTHTHLFEVQLIVGRARLSRYFHSLVLPLQVSDSTLSLGKPRRRRHTKSSSSRSFWEVARGKRCTSRKGQSLIFWPRPAPDKRASDLFKYSSYFLCLKDSSARFRHGRLWLLLIHRRDFSRRSKSEMHFYGHSASLFDPKILIIMMCWRNQRLSDAGGGKTSI